MPARSHASASATHCSQETPSCASIIRATRTARRRLTLVTEVRDPDATARDAAEALDVDERDALLRPVRLEEVRAVFRRVEPAEERAARAAGIGASPGEVLAEAGRGVGAEIAGVGEALAHVEAARVVRELVAADDVLRLHLRRAHERGRDVQRAEALDAARVVEQAELDALLDGHRRAEVVLAGAVVVGGGVAVPVAG